MCWWKLFTFKKEQEIYRERLSGKHQCALASCFKVWCLPVNDFQTHKETQICRFCIQTQWPFWHSFFIPSLLDQCSGVVSAACVFIWNAAKHALSVHAWRKRKPLPLVQEGVATSAGPFKHQSGLDTLVPAHAEHGYLPNVYPNCMQSNMHWVPLRLSLCVRGNSCHFY